jgi:glycosyltransferase involved in cell wall biosynthesis
MRFLPGSLANIARQVDGIVAIDDGSTDGSAALLATRPEVIELLRLPADRPAWDEIANHRRLVVVALRHGGEWLVCVDADERLEADFRARAERVIKRGRLFGYSALMPAVPGGWRTS